MDDRYFRFIGKYALLLSLMYGIEFVFWRYMDQRELTTDTLTDRLLTMTIPVALALVLNIVLTIIVTRDIRVLNLNTRYVTLATLIYRPVGVCAFLLYLLFDRTDKEI